MWLLLLHVASGSLLCFGIRALGRIWTPLPSFKTLCRHFIGWIVSLDTSVIGTSRRCSWIHPCHPLVGGVPSFSDLSAWYCLSHLSPSPLLPDVLSVLYLEYLLELLHRFPFFLVNMCCFLSGWLNMANHSNLRVPWSWEPLLPVWSLMTCYHAWLYMGYGNSNSGPYTCMTGALATEPSS